MARKPGQSWRNLPTTANAEGIEVVASDIVCFDGPYSALVSALSATVAAEGAIGWVGKDSNSDGQGERGGNGGWGLVKVWNEI